MASQSQNKANSQDYQSKASEKVRKDKKNKKKG